jgi:uncharacterized protein
MSYKAPWYLPNGHLQTIIPSLFRRVGGLSYQRERIETPDGDFLDLDWIGKDKPAETLLIISHGLEGDSKRGYVKGMARAFLEGSGHPGSGHPGAGQPGAGQPGAGHPEGIHALAWNYRSCSGEPNKLPHFYHSGATQDLEQVVQHALAQGVYRRIILSGFSLGGNLTLKYLGERGEQLPSELWKAAVFSVPLDLASSSRQIGLRSNRIYEQRFLKRLRRKLQDKLLLQPGSLDLRPLKQIRTLWDFDDQYTAPLHGFRDAADYYSQCSSLKFVDSIRIPTLIVNAKNDPFLSPECYPEEQLKDHPFVRFEAPAEGGHVGFLQGGNLYYSEERALAFVFGK